MVIKKKVTDFPAYTETPFRKQNRTEMEIAVSTWGLKSFSELTKPGVKMLEYVIRVMDGGDTVKVNIEDAMEWCGYSSRTNVYNGISSLIEKSFLARKTGNSGEYFLNGSFIQKHK